MVGVDLVLGLLRRLRGLLKIPGLQVVDEEIPLAGLVEKDGLDDDLFIEQRR